MVAVFADEDTLMPLARQFELDLAANNGTQHTVFSGPEARLAVFAPRSRSMTLTIVA